MDEEGTSASTKRVKIPFFTPKTNFLHCMISAFLDTISCGKGKIGKWKSFIGHKKREQKWILAENFFAITKFWWYYKKKERISAKILVVDFLLTLLFLFFSHRKIKYRQYVKFPCHGPMQVDVIGSEMKLQSVTVSNRFLLRFFIPLHENWKNFPAKCWMVSRIEKEMDGLLSI